jgi:chromosome partitioning protein
VVAELVEEGLPVLEPFIGSSVKVKESHEAAKPLPFFARSHKLTAQFEELFDAVAARRV